LTTDNDKLFIRLTSRNVLNLGMFAFAVGTALHIFLSYITIFNSVTYLIAINSLIHLLTD